MTQTMRRRTVPAVALSVVAHAVVLTVMALHAPILRAPEPQQSLPEPIIPVLLVTRPPPPPEGGPPPEPIRLHRRPQAFARHFPVPPLPAPDNNAKAPPQANKRVAVMPPEPEITPAELRAALRSGASGCANLAILSESEREKCVLALGAGAKFTPYQGQGLAADKQQVFDRAAATKQADARYRRTTPVPRAGGLGGAGASASDMADALGETRR